MNLIRFLTFTVTLWLTLLPQGLELRAEDNTKESEFKYERKASVPNRTDKHRELMDAFAFDIFRAEVEDLIARDLHLITSALIDQFGQPEIGAVKQFDHRDPDPNSGETKIERIIWKYPGMLLTVISYPPVEDHLPESVMLERVEITSPSYELKHSLRIGQNFKAFADLLGPPNNKSAEKVEYRVEDWMTYPGIFETTSYQIDMFLDKEENVKKIVWTWEGVFH